MGDTKRLRRDVRFGGNTFPKPSFRRAFMA
jgi:hypothetical protein